MNAFNREVLEKDMELAGGTGLMENCDECNTLIFNWECVGDRAFLSSDGCRILCLRCWNDERKEELIRLTNIKSLISSPQ